MAKHKLSTIEHPNPTVASADTQECEFCARITKVKLGGVSGQVNNIKHHLFHGTCQECNDVAENNLDICGFCRHLQIPHLSRFYNHRQQHPLSSVQPQERYMDRTIEITFEPMHLRPRSCGFCNFLETSRREATSLPTALDSGEVSIKLSKLYRFSIVWRNVSSNQLIHVKQGRIAYNGTYAEVSEWVDWGWVCSSSAQICSAQAERIPIHLRVIDVLQDCLVDLPGAASYLTLSYVWGSQKKDDFQLLEANMDQITRPGSLSHNLLPLTVADAMIVCKKLGYQYLWVDRFCVVQDQPHHTLMIQLNHMASIYRGAALTLVAASGADSQHGLPGVGRPRKPQNQVKLDSQISLVERLPSLENALEDGTWYKRAWTFQEHIASKACILFTSRAVYIQETDWKPGKSMIRSSSTVCEGFADVSRFTSDWDMFQMIEQYMSRTLTFPTDALRAISGILQFVYGPRVYFGIPEVLFDRMILFKPLGKTKARESSGADVFPTWSWVSVQGAIDLSDVRPFGNLAYWIKPSSGLSGEHDSQMGLGDGRWDEDNECIEIEHPERVTVALAWAHGCIQSVKPSILAVDCSARQYSERLQDTWPTPEHFRSQAFEMYQQNFDIPRLDPRAVHAPGGLLTYTQMANLSLGDKCGQVWSVRMSQNQRLSGFAHIDTGQIDMANAGKNTDVTCIVLSGSRRPCYMTTKLVSNEGCLYVQSPNRIGREHKIVTQGNIWYGCPCAHATASLDYVEHLPECPHSSEVHLPTAFQNRHGDSNLDYLRNLNNPSHEYEHTLSKFYAGVSYLDANGDLLHFWDRPPMLNVMLVERVPEYGDMRNVYRRIGVGEVYLKRWVEASPHFETMVLV